MAVEIRFKTHKQPWPKFVDLKFIILRYPFHALSVQEDEKKLNKETERLILEVKRAQELLRIAESRSKGYMYFTQKSWTD